uniref:Putative ovule protein n=1 Tax=Solanum chacoense TaxID=4108 RepID=A0A0V0GH56_SOLCH
MYLTKQSTRTLICAIPHKPFLLTKQIHEKKNVAYFLSLPLSHLVISTKLCPMSFFNPFSFICSLNISISFHRPFLAYMFDSRT